MAFGTGHHSTTSLIMHQLLEMDLNGATVVDMGTGTGILAILAAMRGAKEVTAVEIDPPAYENAIENVALNGRSEVHLILGDASALDNVAECSADLLTANINRNVITADIESYARVLAHGGTMLLSGFYVADVPVVAEAAEKVGLTADGHTSLKDWACLKLHKK